jgi:hypothetical protein
MINVQPIPNAILQATANEEPATPAAPLTPQNHGIGWLLTFDTKHMPVGKP